VFSLVRFQLGLRKEAFTAMITKQLEVAGVSSHMRQEVSPVAKALVALTTRKFAII
jgi:hypothetical protein